MDVSSNPPGGEEPIAEGMGAIVADVAVVPPDVKCIEIQTSDYRFYSVRKDVTPGQAASIRLAPLTPGTIYVYGTAYSVPCANTYGDYYYGVSDGGPTSSVTWRADATFAQVQAGRTNKANVVFRQTCRSECRRPIRRSMCLRKRRVPDSPAERRRAARLLGNHC